MMSLILNNMALFDSPMLCIANLEVDLMIYIHIQQLRSCQDFLGAALQENRSSGFQTMSDTNWPVQSQRKGKSLKFAYKKRD